MCHAFCGESAYLTAMTRREYPKCERCGHQFYTYSPLGCPECDRLPTAADYATLRARLEFVVKNQGHLYFRQDRSNGLWFVLDNRDGLTIPFKGLATLDEAIDSARGGEHG